MKKGIALLLFIFLILLFPRESPAPETTVMGGYQIFTDTNCDRAEYHHFGIICQDIDDGKVYKWSGAAEIEITGSATGDVAGPSASSDSELPLFSGTSGKTLKRSNTLTGIPKLTSGVVSMATADTDYLTPGTAASTYAPKASPTFTGTPILPTGYKIFDGGTHYYLINVPTLSADVSLTLPSSAISSYDLVYGASSGQLGYLSLPSEGNDFLCVNSNHTAFGWCNELKVQYIDTNVKIADAADTSKQLQFDISNNSSSTLRKVYPPDMDSYIPYYGSSPTVNTVGQIAVDTTANQIKAYGSALAVFDPRRTENATFKTPTSGDKVKFKKPFGMTVTGVSCLVDAATSVVLDVQECNSNGGSCVSILSSTITCGTTNTTGTISDSSIAANNYVFFSVGTVTGTPGFLYVNFDYKVTGE
jgi:hypothetical protein